MEGTSGLQPAAVRSARGKSQRRREAADRKGNLTVPFPELRGSLPKRRHEPCVASVKLLPYRLGHGMEERRRRLLGALCREEVPGRGARRPERTDAMTISPVTKLPLQRLHFPILRACDQSREPSRQRSPASISVEIWSPGQISPSEPLERNVQALKREEDVHSTARAVRSARSKWHRRREAAGREGNFTAPFPELRGSLPERRHEPRVASVKILACRLGQGMEERRRRLLGALRSLVRLLALNGGNPENLASRSLALRRGVRLDLRDQIGGEPSLGLDREVLPAGQVREGERLGRSVAQAIEALPASAGGVLLGPVEPGALDSHALHERTRTVDARPFRDFFDEVLLDPMRENVFQPGHLGGGLAADHDRLISPGPDLVGPINETPELAGEVGVQEAHEARELAGVVDVQDEMEVVGDKGKTTATNRVRPLGPGQDADDEVVERQAGAKEETALEGPAGDLDEGTAFGDVAESSAHTLPKT